MEGIIPIVIPLDMIVSHQSPESSSYGRAFFQKGTLTAKQRYRIFSVADFSSHPHFLFAHHPGHAVQGIFKPFVDVHDIAVFEFGHA